MIPFTSKEKQYRLALSLVPGISCAQLKEILSYFGSAQAVFYAANHGDRSLPYKIAQSIITSNNSLDQAEKIIELHQEEGIQLLTTEEDSYPKRLLDLPDRPSIVYYKGKALLNEQRVVAIVGTRKLTPYGQVSIKKFLEQLLPYQPLVLSGLAYGVDIWVHKEALDMGLSTIAVLPNSVNDIYPNAHKKIVMEMCSSRGGIIAEYPIIGGSRLSSHTFLARNRIIAGLADATVVIEAKEKSDALITAYYANNYNREVFALPGSIYSETSTGCHRLIKRNQAHLLTHISDLIYIMNWEIKFSSHPNIYSIYPLTNSEKIVLKQFKKTVSPISIYNLMYTTSLSPREIQAALLSLELQGLLCSLPDKRFIVAPICK